MATEDIKRKNFENSVAKETHPLKSLNHVNYCETICMLFSTVL